MLARDTTEETVRDWAPSTPLAPGGYFLDAGHTMRHFRDAHFLPQISARQRYEEWQAAGGTGRPPARQRVLSPPARRLPTA